MTIIKWLAALAVLSILTAHAPALPAQSVHIERECPLMSGGCNSPRAMNCNGMIGCNSIMKCNGMMNCSDMMNFGSKCPDDSSHSQGCSSQGCTCQVSLFSSTEASDQGYSYFGKGSSHPYNRESLSTSSSHSANEGAYLGRSRADPDGLGPPDLDVIDYLPPSAKLVFDVLVSDGPLTQKDLIIKTDLPRGTVKYALGKLKEESIIKECFYFLDARQSLYGLNTAAYKAGRK